MALSQIMYLELKTGYNDNGPAWIGKVKYSKSGQTVYFNGRALKRIGGQGIAGNQRDYETGDEYWISGVKKDGNDRHWAGSGKTKIDQKVVDEYLELVSKEELDTNKYELCHDIIETNITKFHQMENDNL